MTVWAESLNISVSFGHERSPIPVLKFFPVLFKTSVISFQGFPTFSHLPPNPANSGNWDYMVCPLACPFSLAVPSGA